MNASLAMQFNSRRLLVVKIVPRKFRYREDHEINGVV